ncbi:hypothetical protein HNV08_08825 [Winogradskyella eckloniae]|uniref:hypothetical protein n=1 Tax=Winogradskyella eckloniae TaxID=1089306 RepID=UPI0015661CE1|nr:hypothetical protein [Winogradskyella eckloniae]NRD20151.1 hypothetical protein [Winogradskyella eckloniae]
MKKFLKNILVFFLLALIVGEFVVRVTHTMSDIPQRTIDANGIQNYYPNQEGYWKGGGHKWNINKLGWPGILPKSNDNLILVIGDSFIENFMNPNECHQSAYLKQNMSNYNFMEAGRSGVSLIEAMEISKNLDSLKPLKSLVYVNDNDFYESIAEVKPMRDITQLKLKDGSIVFGEMKAPVFKKILYNWKLLYYFYTRFPLSSNSKTNEEPIITTNQNNPAFKSKTKVVQLINYIVNNYNIENKVLVFHPNSNAKIIEECKNVGFRTIVLDDSKDDISWTFDYDSHWTCYGHEQVAKQISSALSKNK